MRRFMAVLLASFALVACGDDDGGETAEFGDTEDVVVPGDPEETMESLVQMLFRGQHGRAWDTLHPEYQAVVSRTDYERCQGQRMEAVAGVQLEGLEVIETYDDRVTLPNGDEAEATAVTYEMTLSAGEQSEVQTDTSRLIDVEGQWRWIMADPSEYDC